MASPSSPTEPITKITTRANPYLPTPTERILLAIYPLTLLVGSVFAIIDPTTRNSPYSSVTQSHVEEFAPSYFAQKRNLFNQLFVKKGWAWVTISYFIFLFTHPSTGPSRTLVITPRRLRGILRWVVVTACWVFVTQWFFGPAIIDRSFILTGGQCELVKAADEGKVDMDDTRQFVTGVACKAVGGQWKGGHDISGHVFILVLGSVFLFQEVMHVILRASARDERTVLMRDGAVKSADVEIVPDTGRDTAGASQGTWNIGVKVVLGVASLSWWMLLMTAAFFHTWFEKFTGLLVAFTAIFAIYILPRAVPAWRGIIGMPGI